MEKLAGIQCLQLIQIERKLFFFSAGFWPSSPLSYLLGTCYFVLFKHVQCFLDHVFEHCLVCFSFIIEAFKTDAVVERMRAVGVEGWLAGLGASVPSAMYSCPCSLVAVF